MIEVTPEIALGDDEVQVRAVRASGPGGQHVNKVSTAIELRFDVRGSPALPERVRARLYRLSGNRLTQDGVLVILAQEHRSQEWVEDAQEQGTEGAHQGGNERWHHHPHVQVLEAVDVRGDACHQVAASVALQACRGKWLDGVEEPDAQIREDAERRAVGDQRCELRAAGRRLRRAGDRRR